MKNLKTPEKRLYINLFIHLAITVIIGFIFLFIIDKSKKEEMDYRRERIEIIKMYENKILVLDSLNDKLNSRREMLEDTINSLQEEKIKIKESYVKKIKTIYDDSAVKHAIWLDSIIKELDSNKK